MEARNQGWRATLRWISNLRFQIAQEKVGNVPTPNALVKFFSWEEFEPLAATKETKAHS
jgi:hypothetical protein